MFSMQNPFVQMDPICVELQKENQIKTTANFHFLPFRLNLVFYCDSELYSVCVKQIHQNVNYWKTLPWFLQYERLFFMVRHFSFR